VETNAAAGLKFLVWREEDFMRQCGNDFGVIPRSFDDEKDLFCRIAAARINCKIRGGLESVFKRSGPGSRQENASKQKREGMTNAPCRHAR
jgi:hypothetical protein